MENPPPYSAQETKQNYVPPGVAPSNVGPSQQFAPPPLQSGYYPRTEQPIISIPSVVVSALGPNSQMITCPFCHQLASTRVDVESTTKTHLFALFLCIFLCWPCAPLPYCIDSCKSKNHYCSNCSAFLGAYDP
ncbi:hypothetical protein PPYR_11017 [Photinus pyralis]|uniref:LITAF domain-containing protein n=1 Tax=Photinus pyralis TaxID=7054 RepID=A0A5N4AI54_PHOPY|nr:lipopolysaccharide-induced tumor necrosis factor-alpha factor homolog [Photinus pyralis]XP_031358827.1 lipopolysaccharide-induced tumor necrosis factor-alpha factor homolog [Photinus pyralis]KAB0796956.1 hypothetical protein PPYR_11017 [Photinus pyralis]